MQETEARKDQEIPESEVGPTQKVLDNQLYYVLQQLCTNKKTYDMISNVGYGRGFQLWRRIIWEYEPKLRERSTGLYQAVLSYNFQGDLMDSLEEFNNVVRRYEKASGKTIDDDQKVGLLHKILAHSQIQEKVKLNSFSA